MSEMDVKKAEDHHLRFRKRHTHLDPVFGGDWFALKAEAFARFFGTPVFLIGQTAIVAIWIAVNVLGFTTFDIYPFILLNLAFSLQAAYAAPLILLAQTRQADRDKANSVADAHHREELHTVSEGRQLAIGEQTALLVRMLNANTELTEKVEGLLEQNTELTRSVSQLVAQLHTLTSDIHLRTCPQTG